MKVIIDPACNFFYSSFYIKGLFDLFAGAISFSSAPFQTFKYTGETHCLPFIVSDGKIHSKVVIDFADAREINQDFLEWSDIYGKVNYLSELHSVNSKIVMVGPNYALKIWNKPAAGYIGLINYLKSRTRTVDFYTYISKYLMSAKKIRDLSDIKVETDPHYLYFASTLWSSQHETNKYRANFIRACKKIPGIRFEGGMIPEKPGDGISGFEDIILDSQIDYVTYIKNVKRSAMVFNTPAYHLCHGWKLPEYLALGKAIISTPIKNSLPAGLHHRENVFFVSGDLTEIQEAIIELIEDSELRKKLEQESYKYYLKYIKPNHSVSNLLNNIIDNGFSL